MKRLKIYIETSVWNFLVAEDSADKRKITEKFFEGVSENKYEIFISDYVMDEISEAPEPRRSMLEGLIRKYNPKRLFFTDEFEYLAEKYEEKAFIPNRFETARLHIGMAVVHNMDIVLSWNMRHIVKYRTKISVNSINLIEGFKQIEILTPEEVVEYD